ncbi:MAG: hypothetical protein ACD_73C00231G0002 [uncultured bacterium]|nr:MAG: hypothetical protein ACD_73C00231G0002 [uncultured bacterium]
MAKDLNTYLTKAINQYTPDFTALIPDFKKIEKVVFSGDGLVTGSESTILSLLNKSTVPVLLSDADQKRMKIITEGGGFTLNRYYTLLAKEGLNPANNKDELDQTSQTPIKDYEYDLTNIEVNKDQLSLTLTSPEGKNLNVNLPIHPTEKSLINISAEIYPLTINDVLSSLGGYLNNPLNKGSETPVKRVYREWMEQIVKYQSKLMRDMGHTAQQEISTVEWSLAFKNINWSEEQLSQIDTNFFGDTPDVSQTKAIKQGWEKIPEPIRDLIKQAGYEIHLVGDETLKQLANSNPQINTSPLFAGVTDPISKKIYLLPDMDIAYLTYTVVHECGHAFHDILSSKMGGKNLMGSAHDEILAHHFALRTKDENYEAAPTIYGSTNQNEWFAEMFTLVLLQDNDDVGTNLTENSLGFKYLMNRAKARDMLGTSLMNDILTWAINGQPAECVLNWRDYPKIKGLLNFASLAKGINILSRLLTPLATFSLSKGDPSTALLNFGLSVSTEMADDFLTEELKAQANVHQQLIQKSPCDPLDNDYRYIKSALVTNEADRKKEIIKLYNANKNYYPVKREAYARLLTGYFNPTDVTGIKTTNPTLEHTFTWVETALTQSPDDPVLQQSLTMMLAQENSTPHIKNFEARLLKLAQTVYKANPENPIVKTMWAFSLSRQGYYDEALGYLAQVKEFYQKSETALNLMTTEPVLQKAMNQALQGLSAEEAKIYYRKGGKAIAIVVLELLKSDQGDYLFATDLTNLYLKEGELDKVMDVTEQQNINFDGLDFDTLEWLNQQNPIKYGTKFFVRWNALHPKKQTQKSKE